MNEVQTRDLAIVGMACLFPGAPDLPTYWHNIVAKKDFLSDPPDSWDVHKMYDPQSNGSRGIYCKRGGYLGSLAAFDPVEFGVMPKAVNGGEPDQWLALKVARDALSDAGYGEVIPEGTKTAVVLGKGNYHNRGNIAITQHGVIIDQMLDILRSLHPEHHDEDNLGRIREELLHCLPPFDTDTVSALIPNITAGRIANRLNLMGPSFTVDAACASSLIAVDLASKYLHFGECDLALVGGVHVVAPIQIRQVFCRLGALSRTNSIRPFDRDADGTLAGDGVGMIVLKRLLDARRDGNRIYAVIKGVGVASDGRGLSVTAPRVEGEILALQRAYELTGVSPRSVGLIEAHGTGTPVGDATEIQALNTIFGQRGRPIPWCGIGSVKSNVGHLMPAAGMAGLIKAALALYHKVLPPTLNVTEPIAALRDPKCPFYINSETRPWIHANFGVPRRAGVNAFGFGGINAHAVLEETALEHTSEPNSHLLQWETELFILSAESREGLLASVSTLLRFVKSSPDLALKDLAFTLNTSPMAAHSRLAIVASSLSDLGDKLERGAKKLSDNNCRQLRDPQGIFYFSEPLAHNGNLAFVFPGEGSQYPYMLADLYLHFPEVQVHLDIADRAFALSGAKILPSEFIFPGTLWSEKDRELAKIELWKMQGAVAAVFSANAALFDLLERFHVLPDALLGHSTGEYSAMAASGIMDLSARGAVDYFALDFARLYEFEENAIDDPRRQFALAAIGAGVESVSAALTITGGAVQVAMDNCPLQTVIAGPAGPVAEIVRGFRTKGVICEHLHFARPYHTEGFRPFIDPLRGFFDRWISRPPMIPTYTCSSKQPLPMDVNELKFLALEQWVRPVKFRETIEAMYADGFRLFVEVGARGNLSAFISDILRGRPHLALPSNLPNRSSISVLHSLLGMLAAQGISLDLRYLYSRRFPQRVDLKSVGNVQSAKREKIPINTGFPAMHLSPNAAAILRRNPQVGSQRNGDGEAPRPTVSTVPPVEINDARSKAGNPLTRVVEAHLQTMTEFLDLQQNVMESYFGRPAGLPRNSEHGSKALETVARTRTPTSHGPMSPSPLPLVSRVVTSDSGMEVTAICEVHRAEHQYLRDHSFGRNLSQCAPDLEGIPVVPLTMTVESMAETASLLFPNKCLSAVRQVRAYRWIVPEKGRMSLKIVARRVATSGGEAKVTVCELLDGASQLSPALAEGWFTFAESYSPPPSAEQLTGPGVAVPWPPNRLYEEVMFHGPLFRGVRSIDVLGQNHALATLEVLPKEGLLRSNANPNFLMDPQLLDAAGQVLGFWTRNWSPDSVFFPYSLETLECFGPPLDPGEKLRCHARIRPDGQDGVRAGLELVRADGRVWCRVTGWQDRRFPLPMELTKFWLCPLENMLSEPWEVPGMPARVKLFRIDLSRFPTSFFSLGGGIWGRVLSHCVFGRSERRTWESLQMSESRRTEWILGRIAAKDAVRKYISERSGLQLCPADIEIDPDGHGRPVVRGDWTPSVSHVPAVSISHSGGIAVAAVIGQAFGVGVDIEPFDRLTRSGCDFSEIMFTKEELQLLASIPDGNSDLWRLRLWCAKEAASKALGRGLGTGLFSLQALSIDPKSGVFVVGQVKESARVESKTALYDDFVVAVAVNQAMYIGSTNETKSS